MALWRWPFGTIEISFAMLFSAAVFLLWLASGSAAAHAAAAGFLGGPFTALFWLLVVIVGLVVPLVLEVAETRARPALAAHLLLLVGGLSLRLVLVAAG